MTDYALAGPTRTCAATGRGLVAGEKYVGVLVESGTGFARQDYAAAAWPGPPPGAIAYWAGRVPPDGKPRRPAFDDVQLLGLFTQVAGDDPARVNLRYAVALLLMRRKRLKFEDVKKTAAGEVLVLRDAKSGTRYEVRDPRLGPAEVAAVQDDVFRALGWQ